VTERAGAPDPDAWGVAPGYHAVDGTWVPSGREAVALALAAMGADAPAPGATRTWVVTDRDTVHLPAAAELWYEDGRSEAVRDDLRGLPAGYHRLEFADGPVRLIVAPSRCVEAPERGWGWAAQLYATRSRASWGIGDLADLRRLARWSRRLGASAVLVNPLHAARLDGAPEASPYFPSSRRWRNPLYLNVDAVPGAASAGGALAPLSAAARPLNGRRLVNRREAWRLKSAALRQLWSAAAGGGPEFEAWRGRQDASLERFSLHATIAEDWGHDWRRWPTCYRDPAAPAVAAFARREAPRVAFHAWLQWLLEEQLGEAAQELPLVADLAVGADPGGSDAWQWQSVLATGVGAGAPPDEFSPRGQSWGVPVWDPWRLRAAGYAPFIDLVRGAFAFGEGLRIDHVAGLFRLFWVPEEGAPADGVYVRYPWQDLLNIVVLESHRAGAYVVGEDLGTVEPEVRARLGERGVLSYRLLWFEESPPSAWPADTLTAVSTHDLPTVAGVWSGADRGERERIGVPVDESAESTLLTRLGRVAGAGDRAGVGPTTSAGDPAGAGGGAEVGALPTRTVIERAYAALAAGAGRLVAASLDDALEVAERPNIPGTTTERPNWSLALPLALEDIEADAGVNRLAEIISAGRAAPPAPG
jgi:4-alpha-glucanotransferase